MSNLLISNDLKCELIIVWALKCYNGRRKAVKKGGGFYYKNFIFDLSYTKDVLNYYKKNRYVTGGQVTGLNNIINKFDIEQWINKIFTDHKNLELSMSEFIHKLYESLN